MQSTHYIKRCVPSMMELNYLISHFFWKCEDLYRVHLWNISFSDVTYFSGNKNNLANSLTIWWMCHPEAHFNAKLKRSVCPFVAEPTVDSTYCCSLWGRAFEAVSSALSLNTHHTGNGWSDISNPLLSIPKVLRRGSIFTHGCPCTACCINLTQNLTRSFYVLVSLAMPARKTGWIKTLEGIFLADDKMWSFRRSS